MPVTTGSLRPARTNSRIGPALFAFVIQPASRLFGFRYSIMVGVRDEFNRRPLPIAARRRAAVSGRPEHQNRRLRRIRERRHQCADALTSTLPRYTWLSRQNRSRPSTNSTDGNECSEIRQRSQGQNHDVNSASLVAAEIFSAQQVRACNRLMGGERVRSCACMVLHHIRHPDGERSCPRARSRRGGRVRSIPATFAHR